MQITRKIADNDCANGIDCPRIFELADSRLLVQGYTVTDPDLLLELGLRHTDAAVIVPPGLQVEALAAFDQQPAPANDQQLYTVAANSLVIVGERVADYSDLRTRRLPDGESLVIIPAAVLAQVATRLEEAS